MKDKKLSIIVPVYNVEKYLGECLESLVNQTLTDMEVIVVNDGSTDNCQSIIDEYVKKYPALIKSFVKENGGLSDARNYGLKYAQGKYLTFLDSDDYIEADLYERMVTKAEKENSDLVVGDIEYFFEDNSNKKYVTKGLNKVTHDDKKDLFLSPLFAWNKLYRRDLFEKLELRYPLGLWYEDIPVSTKYFANVDKVSYLEGPAYHYRQRNGSILAVKYDARMYQMFDIFDLVIDEFKETGQFEAFHNEIEYLAIEDFLLYGGFRFLRTDHYTDLMKKAFEYMKDKFPNYKKNPYFKTLSFKNRVFLLTNNKLTMGLWHRYMER